MCNYKQFSWLAHGCFEKIKALKLFQCVKWLKFSEKNITKTKYWGRWLHLTEVRSIKLIAKDYRTSCCRRIHQCCLQNQSNVFCFKHSQCVIGAANRDHQWHHKRAPMTSLFEDPWNLHEGYLCCLVETATFWFDLIFKPNTTYTILYFSCSWGAKPHLPMSESPMVQTRETNYIFINKKTNLACLRGVCVLLLEKVCWNGDTSQRGRDFLSLNIEGEWVTVLTAVWLETETTDWTGNCGKIHVQCTHTRTCALYTHVPTCIHTCTNTCMPAHLYTRMRTQTCTHVHMYLNTRKHTYTYTCVHAHIHTHLHVHTNMHTHNVHTWTHTDARKLLHIQLHTYTHILSFKYTCMDTHLYTHAHSYTHTNR